MGGGGYVPWEMFEIAPSETLFWHSRPRPEKQFFIPGSYLSLFLDIHYDKTKSFKVLLAIF